MFKLDKVKIVFISILLYSVTKVTAFSVSNIFRQGNATVLMGMSAGWMGVAAAVCSATVAVCWISVAMAIAFQAATLAALGDSSGATNGNTKRSDGSNIIPITESMQNVTSDYSDHSITSHPIIKNLTLLLGTYNDLNIGSKLDKRSESILNSNVTVAKFDTHLGHHLAVSLPHLSSNEFIDRLNNATPGEPDVSLKFRLLKRGYQVDWISYNYDNVNKNLAQQFISTQGSDETQVWADSAQSFISSNDGWKWCLDMNIDPSPGEPIDSNHLENIEVAVHGEIYTNTYGGVDGQCNDYYDCVEGCSN